MTVYYSYTESPIGSLLLTSDGSFLTGLYMEDHKTGPAQDQSWRLDCVVEPIKYAIDQLRSYFARELNQFDLPIKFEGTDFQQRVWNELCNIEYGSVISYAELARRIDNPKACRAVGLANGQNPISIIVPCHRVIGSSGSLTGYGGGLERKKMLLELEKSAASKQLSLAL